MKIRRMAVQAGADGAGEGETVREDQASTMETAEFPVGGPHMGGWRAGCNVGGGS